MRIIQGHDYYDSALAWGSDTDVVFVRDKQRMLTAEQVKQIPHLNPHVCHLHFLNNKQAYDNRWSRIPFGNGYVNVSGVRVWVADKNWCGYKVDQGLPHPHMHWSWQSLSSWAQEGGYMISTHTQHWHRIQQVEKLDAGEHDTPPELQAWMIENQITVITHEVVHGEHKWQLNGDNLKHFEMFKVCDPYQMHQRIYQWVGGVLPRKGNPMVQITDDKVKAHKHGFDKYSFRRMPESKK